MLAFIVSLLCIAAAGAAAGIVYVLFGPVGARRSRPVSLLGAQQPLPFAAGPVAPRNVAVFDPARAVFTPSSAPPPLSRTRAARGTDAHTRSLSPPTPATSPGADRDIPLVELDDLI